MKVSIFYTNSCNINCKHCFINKALVPKQMSEQLFIKILQGICSYKKDINLICITGGEPILFLEDIINAIKTNKFNQKLVFSISSNAYWASEIEKTNLICKKLLSANIRRLEISWDLFHKEFVDYSNIYNVVHSCRSLGIDLFLIMSIANGFDYLPLYINLKKILKEDKIILQHVANYGNAQNYRVDCSLPISMFINQKCNQILNPCIDYNGDFYACCGANILNCNSSMHVGNMFENSFDYLVNKMNNNRYYQDLLINGPLPSSYMEDNYLKECSSLCELCELRGSSD